MSTAVSDTAIRQEDRQVMGSAPKQVDLARLKVAIVHDWLIGGGAELVVLELHKMFPDAPIYTSYTTQEWRTKLDDKVITGYLQHLGKIRKFVPFLRARWFSHLNLSGYNLIISSSGAEAKFVKAPKGVKHIAYIHAPTHYYWSRYDEYLENPGFGLFDPLARLGLKLLVGPMRRLDYKAAQRPDYLIANSTHIQAEIKKYYGRDSTVIHPPVDIEQFANSGSGNREGFVVVGRQTPYKRIDLAVRACTELNLPLTVIGNGPDHSRLVQIAGPTIKFVTDATRADVAAALGRASAFIFPALDDFGISAVEALAAGTPVIAYKAGGALDYVVEGVTGEFFAEQTLESLQDALRNFQPDKYNSNEVSKSAQKFSCQAFEKKFRALVEVSIF